MSRLKCLANIMQTSGEKAERLRSEPPSPSLYWWVRVRNFRWGWER